MYADVFSDNPFSTNCWLVSAEASDEAVVVDPGFEPGRIRDKLMAAGKRAVAVLATHGHFDHIGMAGDFCGDDLPLYIHTYDELALTDPAAWGAAFIVEPPAAVKDVRTVTEGDVLEFAGFRIEVAHTPGHTPGSVCYLTDGFVCAGDLVFAGSIGRSDLPNSSPEDMEKSLRRFLTWDDDLDVFTGHGPKTTIGRERSNNPFLLGL
ncbi:MAG: MBL fold metallo-hydrolase [Actinomycetota bacterium]